MLSHHHRTSHCNARLLSYTPLCALFAAVAAGMRYDAMPVEQQQIIQWELDQTEHIVKEAPAESLGWTGHWLRVIKAAEDSGFHPSYPSKFGFGEVTSTRLISDVVDATASCGAVRHGAECFNFWFPQELDKDYLIVWDGFAEAGWTPMTGQPGKVPWQAAKEPELRQFLLERAREGYSFPLNPIWPIRDGGWYAVLQALQKHGEGRENLDKWLPPESGLLKKIEALHQAYPNGFQPAPPGPGGPRKRDTPSKPPPPPLPSFNEVHE